MAKFELERTYSSLVINKQELEKLLNLLEKIVLKDNKDREYKRELTLSASRQNKITLESNTTSELVDFLEEGEKIERLSIRYFGHDVGISFSLYKSLPLTLTLNSIDKGDLLGIEDDIKKFLKKNTWNSFFHSASSAFLQPIIIGLILVAFFFILDLRYQTLWILASLVWILPVLIHELGSIIYPRFVFKGENFQSGRILKKDLKWILAFIAVTIAGAFISKII